MAIDTDNPNPLKTEPVPKTDPDFGKPTEEPYIRLSKDLQGNILRSHGGEYANHILFRFGPEKAKVKSWIRDLLTKDLTTDWNIRNPKGGIFISFAMSYAGYQDLEIPDSRTPTDGSFRRGMNHDVTNEVLGDKPDETWGEYNKEQKIHAMIILAVRVKKKEEAQEEENKKKREKLEKETDKLITQLRDDSLVQGLFVEQGQVYRNPAGKAIEHFGYVDGISQPKFFDYQLKDLLRDPWDPFASLNLVLEPEPDGQGEHFGSYLVFRKLEQNTSLFRDLETKLGDKLKQAGGRASSDAEGLIMGRERNGVPIIVDPARRSTTSLKVSFDYLNEDPSDPAKDFADPLGGKCPFQAHIRKVNPRGEDEFHMDKKRRIARRGISYGEREFDDDGSFKDFPAEGVGLLFICYQRRLLSQFEHLQKWWANDPNFREPSGQDTVIGQGEGNPPQPWPVFWNKPTKTIQFKFSDCVKVEGGEYFFVPSIHFLENIDQL